MDDEHTLSFGMQPNRQAAQILPAGAGSTPGVPTIPNSASHVANTSDWYGRYLPVANASNDFQINRELQRQNRGVAGYTGIAAGIAIQDHAMTWGMGPIYDRSKERLGTTDAMVIRVRRRLHRGHSCPPDQRDRTAWRRQSARLPDAIGRDISAEGCRLAGGQPRPAGGVRRTS